MGKSSMGTVPVSVRDVADALADITGECTPLVIKRNRAVDTDVQTFLKRKREFEAASNKRSIMFD